MNSYQWKRCNLQLFNIAAVAFAILELCGKNTAGCEVDPVVVVIFLGKDNMDLVLILVGRKLVAFVAFDADFYKAFLAVSYCAFLGV